MAGTTRHPSPQLSRRALLKAAAATSIPLLAGVRPGGVAGAATAHAAGPVPGIVKDLPPGLLIPRGTNAEMSWAAMSGQGYLTPADRFFVRNHTATPRIDPATWRLELFGTGLRDQPRRGAGRTFTLRDLQRLPQTTRTTFLECAGNGRSLFATQEGQPAAGTQWGLGAVGVARWSGVLLSELLERAGLRADAVDVMPEGLDDPVKAADGTDQGHVRRPLPLAKALDDTLIALTMNGAPLPPDHGFPARLIVPGWVGIANVKWLGSIRVANRPLRSPWNTTSYRKVGPAYPPDAPPLTALPLKSAFEIAPGTTFHVGARTLLRGRAWSGGPRPRAVEVSTDGGATWQRAHTYGPNHEHAWLRFQLPWTPPATPGPATLLARATDERGHRQPDHVPFNRDGYTYDAVFRLPVTIAG